MNPDWINGLLGGGLIGAAAGLLLLGNGRIAGISGIAGAVIDGAARGLPGGPPGRAAWSESALFVVGLAAAPLLFGLLGGEIELTVTAGAPALIVAGLLVGFGARLGSGCTSGHGVCGAARLSRRSFAAMGTFMAAAMLTVAAFRLL